MMKCVSLFSGCGGLDLGLHQAGFKIISANDLDPYCAESHKINFPETAFYRESVSNLAGGRLAKDLQERGINEIDLLAGGPPCQPFSKSRFYRKEKPRGIQDPTGHETINGFLDLVEELRPRAFLMENVHGFTYKVQSDAFDQLEETAIRLGYSLNWEVLDAADYGVPQHRKRFFAVGMKDHFNFEMPQPTHHNPDKPDTSKGHLLPWQTTLEAIGDLPTVNEPNIPGHFAGGQHHDLLKGVPPGENYLFYTEKRGHPEPKFKWRSRYWSFLLKLAPNRPSWTIQARRSNNMGPFHWQSRILTINEVKRLQTFPDAWHLAGNIEQQWRQIGNAVPPMLAKCLGESIYQALLLEKKGPPSNIDLEEIAICD